MKLVLYFAAFLAFGIGAIHSLLGEKFILMRLFRCADIPHLFGSADFTIRTLRFAWHLTTLAWWGFAALLILIAHPPLKLESVATVIGCTFIAHFVLAVIGTRGKHLSWVVFLVIGVSAFFAAGG